jgi:hypothetical protein
MTEDTNIYLKQCVLRDVIEKGLFAYTNVKTCFVFFNHIPVGLNTGENP